MQTLKNQIIIVVAMVMCMGWLTQEVHAQIKVWTGSVDTDWATAGNWTPSGAPLGSGTTTERAHLTNVTANHTVNYSYDMGSGSISNLILRNPTVGNAVTLNINGGKLTVHSSSGIGSPVEVRERAVLNVNSGATFINVTNIFSVSGGTLNVYGVVSNASVAGGGIQVGNVVAQGAGTINVYAGGTLIDTSANGLRIGAVAAAAGSPTTSGNTMNIFDGYVRVTGQFHVGRGGTGNEVNMSGGFFDLTSTSATDIGSIFGAGQFNLTGGTVTNLGTLRIGNVSNETATIVNAGTLNITGGRWVNRGTDITIGGSAGRTNSAGVLKITGGVFDSLQANINVGQLDGQQNNFNAVGTVTIGGGIFIATNAAGNSALNMRQGSLIITGGVSTIDLIVAPNSVSNLRFDDGTLNIKTARVNNAKAFVVGDGVGAATLNLLGGGFVFTDGVTNMNNAVISGFGTINGAVVNRTGATLQSTNGTLTLVNGLTNAGTINIGVSGGAGATLSSAVAWQNTGRLNLRSIGTLTGGTVTNSGSINSVAGGNIDADVFNASTGTINATNAALRFAGSTFRNDGTIVVGSGGSLHFETGAAAALVWTNYGTLTVGTGGAGQVFVTNAANSRVLMSTGRVTVTAGSLSASHLAVNGGTLSISGSGFVTNYTADVSGTAAGGPAWATLDGSGARWVVHSNLVVGASGSVANRLIVTNGARLTQVFNGPFDTGIIVGSNSTASGNLVLVSDGGNIAVRRDLQIGFYGNNNRMEISMGGSVTNDSNAMIGQNSSGNSVLVTGAGSTWRVGSNLRVGRNIGAHSNVLEVADGGLVSIRNNLIVGEGTSGATYSNNVIVTGLGSRLYVTEQEVRIGAGTGSSSNRVAVLNNGLLEVVNSNLVAGWFHSSAGTENRLDIIGGTVVVTNSSGDAALEARSGTITLNGGTVRADRLIGTNSLGGFQFVSGTMNIATARVDNAKAFVVGDGVSVATLNLSGGGYVFVNGVTNMENSVINGSGTITGGLVNRSGATVQSTGGTLTFVSGVISNLGIVNVKDMNVIGGTLSVTGSGYVTNHSANISGTAGNASWAKLDGSGALWMVHSNLAVGASGNVANRLIVTNRGTVVQVLEGPNDTGFIVGRDSGASGNLVLVSDGGNITARRDVQIGLLGNNNRMEIAMGGSVSNNSNGMIGKVGSGNSVLVTGEGSTWRMGSSLRVGRGDGAHSNLLEVANGGLVHIKRNLIVGEGLGTGLSSSNNVIVTGIGSRLYVELEDVRIGAGTGAGSNRVAVLDGGWLEQRGSNIVVGTRYTAAGIENRLDVLGGTVWVEGTNSGGFAALEARSGTITLNGGTIRADRLIATNSLGGIQFVSGTMNILTAQVANTKAFVVGDGVGAATLTLSGGGYVFNNGVSNMLNSTIRGSGTITGSLVNRGTIFANSATALTIDSQFLNEAGGVVTARNSKLVVKGVFTNAGTVNFVNSVGTFNSAVVNSGAWITDPTTTVFDSNFIHTATGYIKADPNDLFVFTNSASTYANFINRSTKSNEWDTSGAIFRFNATLSVTQDFYVAGIDKDAGNWLDGTNAFITLGAGYVNNFALGTLEIADNTTLRLVDAFSGLGGEFGPNDGKMAALYVNNLFMGANSLLIISSNVQVYFKSSNTWSLANFVLEGNPGLDLTINGLHQLAVIPEPSMLLLLVSGGLVAWSGHRRLRKASQKKLNDNGG